MMNQAFKLAENDYGDMGGWDSPARTDKSGGTGDYEWFQTYIQPYLKSSTVKIVSIYGVFGMMVLLLSLSMGQPHLAE